MPKKIDPQSRDEQILGNTVKEMLGKKEMVAPLCITWLIECAQMLPINLSMHFSKVYGRWAVSNTPIQTIREHTQTDFTGLNFIVVEFSLETALARAIHYYYHTEEKNNGILHCENGSGRSEYI